MKTPWIRIASVLLPGLLWSAGDPLLALEAPAAARGTEAARGANDGSTLATPEDLWRGYDPEALPLDVEVLLSWKEEGIAYEKLRFTGEVADGTPTRVLAVRGRPEGKEGVAGILHIHGGGQTVSPAWVRYWGLRGYACVSYDFCGRAYDRTEFTDWGRLPDSNMMAAGDGYMSRPDPRDSSWYHWVVAARRALTLLSAMPGVDRDRLGIFGISVGGTLCWKVAAADARVKTAVPLYGCGYNVDDRRGPMEAARPSPEQWNFKRLLSPEALAPYITCPVLFLSATNDMHGRMPTAYEILGVVRAQVRAAFTPRYDHHIEPEQAADLPLWMEWQLRGGAPWPGSPSMAISLDGRGVAVGTVSADRAGEVRRVEVYSSLGDKVPGARFWRKAAVAEAPEGRQEATPDAVAPAASPGGTPPAAGAGRAWEAPLPVADAWKSLSAFANVTYESGACLSSNLVVVIPGQLGRARATLEWSPRLDDDAGGLETWTFVPAYVDPNVGWKYLRTGDEDGGKYLEVSPEGFGSDINFHIGTHAIGDPGHEGRPGMALEFEYRGAFKSEIVARLVENDRLMSAKSFEARLAVPTGDAGWQAALLPLSAFQAEGGGSPAAWKDADRLELKGVAARSGPPRFRGFRWVAGAGAGS